jgi:hypothetical protein
MDPSTGRPNGSVNAKPIGLRCRSSARRRHGGAGPSPSEHIVRAGGAGAQAGPRETVRVACKGVSAVTKSAAMERLLDRGFHSRWSSGTRATNPLEQRGGYPETYPLASWTTLHLSKGLSHISKCGDPFSGTRDVVLRFQQGDHLRVRRRLGYFHHGIYVDDERCEFDLSAGTMNRHHSGPRTALEDRAVARNCT